jgi:hypothetical protein
MFWWTEASVSCNNLSAVVTYKHIDFASSSTHLQLIGGGRAPGESGKYNPNTPILMVQRTRGLKLHHLGQHSWNTSTGATHHQILQQAPNAITESGADICHLGVKGTLRCTTSTQHLHCQCHH